MNDAKKPARHGPYHRRTRLDPSENERVVVSKEIWGRPRGNIYAGLFPAVKAWSGPLPEGIVGYEFYTDAEPDPGSSPAWPLWREGGAGVRIVQSGEIVAISVSGTIRSNVMRRAKPQELRTRAVPVMTAQMTEAELKQWLPVRFDRITDPLATPEPSTGALIQLETGGYVVVYYGEDSNQLTLEIPESTQDSSALVAAFMNEAHLPPSRVLWHRADIVLPKRGRRPQFSEGSLKRAVPKRSARSAALPKSRK